MPRLVTDSGAPVLEICYDDAVRGLLNVCNLSQEDVELICGGLEEQHRRVLDCLDSCRPRKDMPPVRPDVIRAYKERQTRIERMLHLLKRFRV